MLSINVFIIISSKIHIKVCKINVVFAMFVLIVQFPFKSHL